MEINLVGEGLKFMILGMTIVFIFLFTLIQIVKIQAKIINKLFPEKIAKNAAHSVPPKSTGDAQQHIAVIVAAVTEFRKNQLK